MRFEDLEVWKKATKLCGKVYKELDGLKDWTFRDQITRSVLSVPSNIAEGFERESKKESLTFFSYARGSCGELRTQIVIGMEIGYIDRAVGDIWLSQTSEISAMLSSLIKTGKSFVESTNRSETGKR